MAQAGIGSTLTFYDLVARTLVSVGQASVAFAEQTAGLLGHMLVFSGHGAIKITELTFKFIKWVFDQTSKVLYRAVNNALDGLR